jgi:hypothetical protein
MIYVNLSRSGATDNIIVNSGTALYIEAFLNNANSPNSSAYNPTPALAVVKTGDTAVFAFQSVDIDGDSVIYQWYQPRTTNNAVVPYIGMYNVNNPMDGFASINPGYQTMAIYASSVGYYTLALKANDYRNGVLVGTSVRDFSVFAMGSMSQTNPLKLAPNTAFYQTTCPGNTNAFSYTFTDPNPSDTVSLTVTTPTIPGFTFNVSNTPGMGSATTSISWTTPTSYNPATLPYFYFQVQAKDNHCPVMGVSNYVILVTGGQCQTDSVWAGDANGDYSVNIYDPLAIAVAYGDTGVVRPNATTNWQAEYCGNWTSYFMSGVNMKHADCNGDGLVDTSDLNAINTNWGDWHLKPAPAAKVTNVPDLYFDISGIVFTPGTTVTIPIKLGTTAYPMNNIYGIAGKISVGGITLTGAPQLTFNPSWLGTASNTLHFVKTNLSSMDWALARIDHANTSGNGTVANLKLTIPASEQGKTISLSFVNTKIINKTMQAVTSFNAVDTSVFIPTVSVNNLNVDIENAIIFPNPSHGGDAYLHLVAKDVLPITVQVTDISGKMIQTLNVQAVKGKNIFTLPTQGISSGVYFVKIISENASLNMKWVKE